MLSPTVGHLHFEYYEGFIFDILFDDSILAIGGSYDRLVRAF